MKDYIDTVSPISSSHIEKNYSLGVSPATIRNDLKELIDKGYLLQPHTSAGRVPSDKGYRYFVNKLLRRREVVTNKDIAKRVRSLEKRMENEVKFLRELTGFLAGLSSSLTYSYLKEKDLLWKEGFEETLHDPEFKEIEKVHSFLNFVKEFERSFEDSFSKDIDRGEVKIYIGKENPLENKDFSILVSKCKFSDNTEGMVALLGPKRMAYDKNISLINSLVKLLESDDGREKRRKKEE